MKKSHLHNLILESYAEILTELNEAPYQTTYIKVAKPDYKIAMRKLDKELDPTHVNMDIVDDDGDGNVIIYFNFRSSDDGEPGEDVAAFIYDVAMDLQAQGINLTGASHDIEEGTGVSEVELKKGDSVTFKVNSVIWYILGVQGDTYRINQQGERNIGFQPKDWLHSMIASGKATVKTSEDSVDEIDNSDMAMKLRAARTNKARAKHTDTKFAVGRENNIERTAKIKDLQKKRAQVLRDMEQEAEPEGGPIADKYGIVLNKIDQVLLKLRGTKNVNYDDRNLQESLLDDLTEEEEEPTPEEEPNTDAPKETVLEDATDTILAKFPTLAQAIIKLQTEEFKQFVDTIDWISPRPTSFRVNLKNGQDYILKWTGKTFEAQIMGKRYVLSSISDYQQALDKLALLYRESPMKGAGEEGGEFDADAGGGGGGGGEFPGEEGGAEGGEDLGGEEGGAEGGEEAGGEDLTDEPIDFEDGEEG